jgi:hypothetical protein
VHAVTCTVPATLTVRSAVTGAELQQLELESVVLDLDEEQPAHWRATLEDDDFDFDGHRDLAIPDTQEGPYGSTTYAAFLLDPRRGALVLSEELSDLTRENMGLFQVDGQRRRLVVSSKSGCCIHSRDEYAFFATRLTLIDSVEENATAADHTEVIHRQLVDGEWRTATRRTALAP